MDVLQAITERRSIRSFDDRTVDEEQIADLLFAATSAPSGKNTQPWRFVVLQGAEKSNLVEVMRDRLKDLKESGRSLGSAEQSARVMDEAPVVVVVFNANHTPGKSLSRYDEGVWSVDIQSTGAAIQNMILAAENMGLGTLWICDVFFADKEIRQYLQKEQELVAAVAVGHKDENPPARPRLAVDEVTEWR